MQAIREAVIRLKVEQTDADIKAPDLDAVIESVDQTTEAYHDLEEAQRAAGQAAEDAAGDISDATASSAADAKRATSEMTEANIRAAEGFKMAGEGAFTAARGVAFLTASNEENFQAAMRTIAAAQGVFDIFKGLTDVVKGLSEANKALAAASAAATTAQTAATGQAAALSLALGPVGVGVAAVLAIGITAWAFWSDEAESAGEAAERAMDKARKATEDYNEELRKAADLNDRIKGFQDAEQQLQTIEQELAKLGPSRSLGQITRDTGLDAARSDLQAFQAGGQGGRGIAEFLEQERALKERVKAAEEAAAQEVAKQEGSEPRRLELLEERARIEQQQLAEKERELERQLAAEQRKREQAEAQEERSKQTLGLGREISPQEQISRARAAQQEAEEAAALIRASIKGVRDAVVESNEEIISELKRSGAKQAALDEGIANGALN